MPSGKDIGMGALGFLSGLTTALERLNERNKAERAATLQLLGKQGYQISPAQPGEVQRADFLTRLAGGTTIEPTTPGTFVAELGGRPFVARRPPPVNVGIPSGMQLTPQEEAEFTALLAPFAGKAATPQLQRELLGVQRQFLRDVQVRRRQDAATLLKTKADLLSSIRGHPEAAGLSKSIRSAQSMDDLLSVIPTLPAMRAITSRVELAYRAAAGDAAAQHALTMLPRDQFQATLSSLAFIAEGGGGATPEEQAQARRAIETIREIRATGVKKARRGHRQEEAPGISTPVGPPLRRLEVGAVEGEAQGALPRVKSFRRIK